MFNARFLYAVTLIRKLAEKNADSYDQTVSIQELSLNSTTQYAENVFSMLKNIGLVQTRRGPNGGYYISANEVTALDILKATIAIALNEPYINPTTEQIQQSVEEALQNIVLYKRSA